METNGHFSELLTFFKALSDENRLKIIGLLAARSYTVESLAETLGLSRLYYFPPFGQACRSGAGLCQGGGTFLQLLIANGEIEKDDTANVA